MNRRGFVKNVIAGTAGLYLGSAPFDLIAGNEAKIVTILHTNDIHCHINPFDESDSRYAGKGGIARIAGYAKKVKEENPNTLLLDAGDMFQGTPYFNYYKGELIFKTMSEAGYDAGTIGNHEFDNGLKGIKNPLKNAEFPLINSNYDFSGTILKGKFPQYKIFKKSGIKIGIYGLGIELKGLVSEKNYGNTIYNDPLSTALEMEKFLVNEKKCDLVICLSHLGLRYEGDKISDVVIASETYSTDLIIGGHTHTYLENPLEVTNKSGKKTIVNQALWGGLMIGRIDFVLSSEKEKETLVLANKFNK